MNGSALVSRTADVDGLLAEAEANKYGSLKRMLDAAQAAAVGAQALGDLRRFALALTQQAWAYANLNRYEPALTHMLQGVVLARTHGFVDIEARAINTIALCFVQCGIVHELIRLYEYQLELGQRLQNGELQATALHDRALIHLNEGETDKALALLYQALMPPDAHGGLDHCVAHGNLALAHEDAGHLDQAMYHAREGLSLARNAECAELMGNAHVIFASVYRAAGDLEAAYGELAAAREFVEVGEPTPLAANIESLSARILAHEGRHQDAIVAWERAYDLAVRGQMIEFAIFILNKIKETHEQSGDLSGVVGAYQRLTQDIPRLQRQGSDLRFAVLRMVFDIDKATHHSEMEMNQQKNAILQRLSHEFRTPLTIIQSTAELVEKYGERLTLEQRQERLQRITGQVKWMTVILEDIVELLKLDEGGAIAMTSNAFMLEDLAQAALDGLDRYRLPDERVRVTAQPDAGIIHGPLQMLTTILVQLLSNAIKFSRSDVTLELRYDSHALRMRVADQGIGIRLEDQGEIFKPLVRGSNLDEVTGTGIGLAIVSKLVSHLHGTIDLASTEGVGTTVTVQVPQ